MGLTPGQQLQDLPVDVVFIGSCTNSRIEDIRAAAAIARGRKVADGVRAMVVPGSRPGEEAGRGTRGSTASCSEAGFEWREAGCSMCLGMNPDKLTPGQRCASTSNRNFEGRQGPGGRTHLLSPAMAAAAALAGQLADVRDCQPKESGVMQAFTTLTGIAAPLPMANVDTDKIIPARFLKSINRSGFGKHLFANMRFREDGTENPDFVLNQEPYRNAEILIAFENFGCGSSREHAPWALLDFGIRCVIAPDFADIFHNNCFKNGVLPVRLPREVCEQLMEDARLGGNARLTVDLERQVVVRPNGEEIPFEVDPLRKHLLLNGLDDIGQTLQHAAAIDAFEAKQQDRAALAAGLTARATRRGRTSMPANKKLLILPGDGIGPEVMREVRRVIDWMDRRRRVSFDIEEGLVGGAAIDATGSPCPDATVEKAPRGGCGAVRQRRRPEMGQPALRQAARARHPAAAQGPRPVRQPAARRWCSTRWSTPPR